MSSKRNCDVLSEREAKIILKRNIREAIGGLKNRFLIRLSDTIIDGCVKALYAKAERGAA